MRFLLLASALGLMSSAQAAESGSNRALREALTCVGDPLDAVQSLAAQGSTAYDKGYAGYEIGEEIDTKSIVLLRTPVEIAGATTHAVVAGPAALRDDFEALVQARFTGDWRPVSALLQLQPGADGSTRQRAVVDDSGDASEVCPMTIYLKPLDDGAFLLGCGWCNG